MRRCLLPMLGVIALAGGGRAWGQGLLTPEMSARRAEIMANIQAAERRDLTDESRMDGYRKGMKAAAELEDTRRELVGMASKHPGKALDAFLTEVLAGDGDSGIRSAAATALGKIGGAEVLQALLNAAGGDKQSRMMMGDVAMDGMSARRAAMFAVAELAGRVPAVKDAAAAGLAAMVIPAKGFESESLPDARQQALFQITRDKAILEPFLNKLTDANAGVRRDGVVAFQYFKLDKAPLELVALMKDPERDVRSSVAEVLAAIADPQTIDALKAAAGDVHEAREVRISAIEAIGRMKRAETAAFLELLLKDEDTSIHAVAAIALYRVTGKKVSEFPLGYDAD